MDESITFPQNPRNDYHTNFWSCRAMRHHMRMFGRVLERPKVIVLVTESHRKTLIIIDNTWPTSFCWPQCGPKCVKIWVLCADLYTRSSSGWVLMTNVFSKFKNMNDQLSNAPSTMFLRCLVMFLHFYTYAFESAQKAMSCMIPIYQSGVFS